MIQLYDTKGNLIDRKADHASIAKPYEAYDELDRVLTDIQHTTTLLISNAHDPYAVKVIGEYLKLVGQHVSPISKSILNRDEEIEKS